MAQVKNVSGTAFVVAEFRAEENDEAYPLYRDPIVKLFLSEESRQAADRIAAGFPLVKEMVKIRTRYYDDMLQKQISLGCQQVVLLGAGLDTRAVRKPAAGVTYFEIDDSATLTLKQARYEENGIHANVRFIPGNYVTDGLIDLLNKNGFDFDLPTYLIWEGNTMYLTEEIDKAVMVQIRERVRQFRLSFDYMADAMILKTTGKSGLTRMVENFASMGAPWVTGFDDIQALASEVKLRFIENFKTGDLYKVYRVVQPLDPPVFGGWYSICTLGSQGDHA